MRDCPERGKEDLTKSKSKPSRLEMHLMRGWKWLYRRDPSSSAPSFRRRRRSQRSLTRPLSWEWTDKNPSLPSIKLHLHSRRPSKRRSSFRMIPSRRLRRTLRKFRLQLRSQKKKWLFQKRTWRSTSSRRSRMHSRERILSFKRRCKLHNRSRSREVRPRITLLWRRTEAMIIDERFDGMILTFWSKHWGLCHLVN